MYSFNQFSRCSWFYPAVPEIPQQLTGGKTWSQNTVGVIGKKIHNLAKSNHVRTVGWAVQRYDDTVSDAPDFPPATMKATTEKRPRT
jgi:hypothetical protein